MEHNKKKFTVNIAGDTLTLVTDESDDFVADVAQRLNRKMTDLTRSSFRITKYDAALLCALDAMGEKTKADKRIRTVESQLSVAQLEIKKLKEQLQDLQTAPAVSEEEKHREPVDESLSRMVRSATEGQSSEDRVQALENYLEARKTGDDSQSREDKIKYIESLLRGSDTKA